MSESAKNESAKKLSERLELAQKLDDELDDFIQGLEKKSYTEGWPEDRWEEEMEKHPFFMKNLPEPGDELPPLMQGLQDLKYGAEDNTAEGHLFSANQKKIKNQKNNQTVKLI